MRLEKLIQNLDGLGEVILPEDLSASDIEVTGLMYDSRKVRPGDGFLAMRGYQTDGHRYISQAAQKGAVVIFAEEIPDPWPPVSEMEDRDAIENPHEATGQEPPLPEPAETRTTPALVLLENTRKIAPEIATRFYGQPSRQLKVAGVTGTNGKTTTAWLMRHLCEGAMMRSGLIGTIGYYIGEEMISADRTTPEAVDMQRLLSRMVNAGCRAAVFEVSSHAVALHRTDGIEFNVLVFSNLSQDHLDFHGTMENYFQAKADAFRRMAENYLPDPSGKKKPPVALINADDNYGKRLAKELSEKYHDRLRIFTFGMGYGLDFRASDIRAERRGTSFSLQATGRKYLVRSPLIGKFNVFNALSALLAVHYLGVDLRTAIKSLEEAPQVPGRLELVTSREKFSVFVDYAHTDDALINVLRACRELPHERLLVVFGCGGDRDRAKRPKMAAAVEDGADYAFVTSDNPRTEDPERILDDIVQGFRGNNFEVIADRRAAIEEAIMEAHNGDIVLIAGKGHETYQELATGRINFDDVKEAKRALVRRHEEYDREY